MSLSQRALAFYTGLAARSVALGCGGSVASVTSSTGPPVLFVAGGQ